MQSSAIASSCGSADGGDNWRRGGVMGDDPVNPQANAQGSQSSEFPPVDHSITNRRCWVDQTGNLPCQRPDLQPHNPMFSCQVTRVLHLSEQRKLQLELHSFLNMLTILMGEIQLIKLRLNGPQILSRTSQLADDLLALVRDGRLDAEASRQASALHALFLKEWSDILRLTPRADNQLLLHDAAANLDSILKVMSVRLAEFQERLRHGDSWVPHNIRQLTDNFVNFFSAVEKNSKGRYHIIYNIASQSPIDYLVNFRIDSVDGDAIRMPTVLQDVFRDLIANARKYTPPGGQITAGLHDDGVELKMVVEDTGCGIPADEIEQVVEFGYRASNVRDKSTQGGGFGLTKAYHVTTRLGGVMWIASTLNKGTRVTLRIPRTAAQDVPSPTQG